MRARFWIAAAAAIASVAGLQALAYAEPTDADRLAVAEKAIQALQAQVDALQKEVTELRATRGAPLEAPPAKPAAVLAPAARVQVFGYLQPQFETGSAGASRFLVRRSRLGVRGQLERNFGYEIQADLAASTATLRNAFIDYVGWQNAAGVPVLRFGQFKLPYSLEAIESSTSLSVIERALVVEQLAVSHDRDTGLALLSKADPRRPYAYQLSVTNGAGRNQFGATRSKLFAGRVQINTPQRSLEPGRQLALGFSTRQGHGENRNRPAQDQAEDERYGVDLDYMTARWHLRSEYLWGRNDNRKPHGYYGLGAYRLLPALELVGRYEGFSADIGGRSSAHRTTLGLNYFLSARTKAMLDYEFLNGRSPDDLHSGVRFRLQTVFP